VSTVINWRSLLRQFVGTLLRGNRTTSIKRINKRYPYIHPGTKRSYQAKLLLAMDQSGSVDNDMLADFFQELSTLARKLDVELLPFDCSADARDIFKWKRGTNPKLTRTKAGGTNFSAATEVFNDPKNRGRWDGLMILTDGEAPAPVSCRGKRGWILGKGQKLHFSTSELQIFLSKETPMTGAWR
jgi:predicted metal-dependent peptidase